MSRRTIDTLLEHLRAGQTFTESLRQVQGEVPDFDKARVPLEARRVDEERRALSVGPGIQPDHPADSLDNLWDELNNVDFIRVDQFYHVIHRNGDKEWQYKGPMLVSTNHIGKVQEFVAREEEAY